MRRGTIAKIVGFALFVFLFFLLQLRNPYISAYFSSLYTIEGATLTQRMLPSGEFEVAERITYRMRKPFRGVFREIPPSRYVEIQDVQMSVEEVPPEYIEWIYQTDRGFSARVWLVPFGSALRLDPRNTPRVTLLVRYRARYVFENGPSLAQVFRQFWGEWDSWASNVRGIFEFPEGVRILKVFTHPRLQVEKEGNRYTIVAPHLPPKAIAEVRFVAEPIPELPYAAANPFLTLEDIEREEGEYRAQVLGTLGLSFGLFGGFILLLVLIYLFFGREPLLEYHREYEQEPPSSDPPDVVNAVVKNIGGSVDEDGIASVFLDLYHLDLIDFAGDGETIVLKAQEAPQDLPESEQVFYDLLVQFAENGKFSFQDLRSKLERSLQKAKSFNTALSAYRKTVARELLRRRYLQTTGNVLAKVAALFMIFASLAIYAFALRPVMVHFLPLSTVLSGGLFFTGVGVLLARRDLFGRWTKEGRLFYLRWKNFGRFLEEYSLIAEHPPESIVLWEKYLIYATALGLGEKVLQHLRRIVPHEVWEKESRHGYFYGPVVFAPGKSFARLSTVALATVAQASSGKGGGFGGGGFRGGAGGFGGGSGGGRGGAF